jgi:flagellar motor component MotA
MRKKALIIPIAIVVLLTFGVATSAHAFVDPISLSIIIGASFFTLVTANEVIKRGTTKPVQEQANAPELKQKVDDSSKISKVVTTQSDDFEK